jgi:hypothetical protein
MMMAIWLGKSGSGLNREAVEGTNHRTFAIVILIIIVIVIDAVILPELGTGTRLR